MQRRVARDLDVEARIALAQLRHQRGKPAVHDRFDHADPDQARIAGRVDVAPHFPIEPHDPLRVGQHAPARRRERGRARVAVEQAHVERFLERCDAARHGSLRRMQFLGREPEVFQLREPDEGFQKPDVHRIPNGEAVPRQAADRDDVNGFGSAHARAAGSGGVKAGRTRASARRRPSRRRPRRASRRSRTTRPATPGTRRRPRSRRDRPRAAAARRR